MNFVRFQWYASLGVFLLVTLPACNSTDYKADRSYTNSKDDALNGKAFRNSANGLAPPPDTIPGSGDGGQGDGVPGSGDGSGGSSGNPNGDGGSSGGGSSGNGGSGSGGGSSDNSGGGGSNGGANGSFASALLCSNNVAQKAGTYLAQAQGMSVKVFQGTSSGLLYENKDLATAYQLKTSVLNGTANLSLGVPDGTYHVIFCDVNMHASCQPDANLLKKAESVTDDSLLNYSTTGVLGIAPKMVISGGKIFSGKAWVLRDRNDSTAGKQGGCDDVRSPLVIDVSGNGIELSSPDAGVDFDIAGTGVKHRISWPVLPTTAFLALDRDGNGNIDSVHELFGDRTIGPDGLPAANGFEALRKYDANHDGWIDDKDPIYAELVLWFDRNRDGIASSDELQSLSEAQLLGIDLDYRAGFEVDDYGNQTRERSVSVFAGDILRTIFDIWFKI